MDLIFSQIQDRKQISSLMNKANYEIYKFEDVLLDVSSKGKKIKQEDYLKEGIYPIIDQGNNTIAGYANSFEGIYVNSPVIIFGDHTRCIKYVDTPLFLGADGVKMLTIKLSETTVDSRFIYFYLKNINVPNTGYNRHFKYLKEIIFAIPPIQIQKKIVEVLDKAQEQIDARKKQIELIDDLILAVFCDMFGELKKNNVRIKVKTMNDICIKITDGTHQSPRFMDYGIPFLFVSNITNGEISYKTSKYISEDNYNELIKKTPIEIGDILYTIVGSYGKPAVIKTTQKFCFQRHIAYLKPNHKIINSTYLTNAMCMPQFKNQLEKCVKGVAQKTLNLSELKKMTIGIPAIELQNQFVKVVNKIDLQKKLMKESLAELENNYSNLMQKAFNGELFDD